MAPEVMTTDEDWLARRLPVGLRNPDKLRAWLRSVGMTVDDFKQLPVYKANLPQFPWLASL